MITYIFAIICVIKGLSNALYAMNNVRKYPRPIGTVDKNIFLYLIGQ
jgi:hypothetical protein